MNKNEKAGNSDELYKALIDEHGKGNLRILEVPLDDSNDEYLEVVAKIPNRRVMSQYMKFVDNNPDKAQQILVKNCVVTNKEAVLNDDALFLTTVSLLAELIPIREGRIKKL